MSPALFAILLWLVVRAVRARRTGKAGAATHARTSADEALPIAAAPRAALAAVAAVAVAILSVAANGRAAQETLDGLLLLAGAIAFVLRLVPKLPPRLGWAANVALAVAAGNLAGFVLADLARGKG